MRTTPLNPWHDAADIAKRLALPHAQLVVMLGAQTWCQKCRDFYPAFENLANQDPSPHRTWLWLDLDDHAEFIGDFIPDDLPLLLVYHGADLQVMTCVPAGSSLTTMIESRQPKDRVLVAADPGIRQRLLRTDWAHC